MRAKEITASFRMVKNLGNYQSAAFEANITIILEENEKAKEAYELAWTSVKNEVEKQIATLKVEGK